MTASTNNNCYRSKRGTGLFKVRSGAWLWLSVNWRSPPSRYRTHAGFGLIEVLVAMIILSIGLLALTSLQLGSLKATNEARVSTSITLLTQEMADRIRVNRAGWPAYDNTSLSPPTTAGTDCATDAAVCNPTALVAFDTKEWIDALEESVGFLVRGSINRITTVTPNEFVIRVQWDANRTGSLPAATACPASNATVSLDPAGCYRLRFTP